MPNVSTYAAAGAVALGALVAAAGFGVLRAEGAKSDGGARYICSPMQHQRACVYIQNGYGSSWGLAVDSDHNGAQVNVVNGTALHAASSTGGGVLAESGSFDAPVLAAIAHNASTNLFRARNAKTGGNCLIDKDANLTCSGSISGAGTLTRHRNSSGQEVRAYEAESATATIEDVGTARITGGVANVRIDPAFASVIDHKWYYVFLTPLGDTRGLYVSAKTPAAFQVREVERGRSSLEFDYRIVAHPMDADNDRLPPAPVR